MLPLIRADLAGLAAYKVEESQGTDYLEIDKLDANEVAIDLPEWFKQKLGAIAQSQIAANRYPDGEYLSLKRLLADYVGVGADQISIGNGSDELIRSLLMAVCLHSGSILVAEPTFSMYDILARTLGIPVVKVARHSHDFSIDLDSATAAIASSQLTNPIKAVFLVHPNSPTGNLLTPAEIDWVRSLSEDILVVIDEAYFEFTNESSLVSELAAHPNWVILRTFSKAFRLAAYRVGYAIAAPELILGLEKVRLPYNLPSISYAVAELAMIHRSELLTNIPEICAERDRLYSALQGMNITVWPGAANFLYLRTANDKAIVASLKAQGTLIRQTGGGLRLTIGTPEQNQRTLERILN